MNENRANRIAPARRQGEIIASASELFAAQGFIPTTMDDIAAGANITKRTLYRYFASKDELLFAIHDSFSGHAWAEARPEGADPYNTLLALIGEHVHLVCSHTTEISVFFEQRKHISAEQARLVDSRREVWQSYAADLLSAGTATGVFRALPSRPTTALVLGSMTDLYRWYRPDGRYAPAELADLYARFFLKGIGRDRSWTPPDHSVPPPLPAVRDESDNKERVCGAATRAFALKGYHATSMRDLAHLAEVSKGAVMYHAGYKQDLLAEIHRRTFEEGIELVRMATADGEDDSMATILYKVVRAQIFYGAYNRDGVAVINDNMRFLEPRSKRKFARLREAWLQAFQIPIDAGLQSEEFQFQDGAFVVRALIGMINSVTRWYRLDGELAPDELAALVTRLVLVGIEEDDLPVAIPVDSSEGSSA